MNKARGSIFLSNHSIDVNILKKVLEALARMYGIIADIQILEQADKISNVLKNIGKTGDKPEYIKELYDNHLSFVSNILSLASLMLIFLKKKKKELENKEDILFKLYSDSFSEIFSTKIPSLRAQIEYFRNKLDFYIRSLEKLDFIEIFVESHKKNKIFVEPLSGYFLDTKIDEQALQVYSRSIRRNLKNDLLVDAKIYHLIILLGILVAINNTFFGISDNGYLKKIGLTLLLRILHLFAKKEINIEDALFDSKYLYKKVKLTPDFTGPTGDEWSLFIMDKEFKYDLTKIIDEIEYFNLSIEINDKEEIEIEDITINSKIENRNYILSIRYFKDKNWDNLLSEHGDNKLLIVVVDDYSNIADFIEKSINNNNKDKLPFDAIIFAVYRNIEEYILRDIIEEKIIKRLREKYEKKIS